VISQLWNPLNLENQSLVLENSRGRSSNIKVKRASSLLHGVCGQSRSRWAPRSAEAQRPPFPARGHSASDCDGGPLCPRALYARRDTRILLRNVCPCAMRARARVFVSSVLLLFFPVLPFLGPSFSPPVSPRAAITGSRPVSLSPRGGPWLMLRDVSSVSPSLSVFASERTPCESSARVSAEKRATHVLPVAECLCRHHRRIGISPSLWINF